MTDKKNYYRILEITDTDKTLDNSAFKSKLKSNYRRLCKLYHPDKHAGDKTMEDKFKEISEAYEVLSDDVKREQYDNPVANFGDGFDSNDLSDLFGSFFGGHGNRGNTTRNLALLIKLDLTLEEAYFGTEKEITYSRNRMTGDASVCTKCNGVGFIDTVIQFGPNHVMNQRTQCPVCGGSGRIVKTEPEERTINIKIHRGVYEGENLRVANGGNMGQNGVYGDLIVTINYISHPKFKRIDNDLYYSIEVPFPKYIMGAEVIIPHFDGDVKLKTKPAQKSKQVLRLGDKGFTRGNSKGVMYIEMTPKIPQSLTQREIDLLNELSKEENFSE